MGQRKPQEEPEEDTSEEETSSDDTSDGEEDQRPETTPQSQQMENMIKLMEKMTEDKEALLAQLKQQGETLAMLQEQVRTLTEANSSLIATLARLKPDDKKPPTNRKRPRQGPSPQSEESDDEDRESEGETPESQEPRMGTSMEIDATARDARETRDDPSRDAPAHVAPARDNRETRDTPACDNRENRDAPARATRDPRVTRDPRITRDAPARVTRETRDAPAGATRDAPARASREAPARENRDAPGRDSREAPSTSTATQQAKPRAIPPIHLLKSQRWTTVSKEMDRLKIAFTKARTTSQGVQIQPATAQDFRRLVKLFRETKEEHFTYSLEEEKPLRIVVRGIPSGITEEEVMADLTAQGFHPSQVTRMKSRRDKQAMPLVLVQVPQEEREILQVNRCCLLVVRVEEQRAPTEPSQCHRCQRFGHGQSRCTAAPRCVKCAGDHHSGDCAKPRDTKAKCANCQGEHPASYRGCPQHPNKTRRKPAPPPQTATQDRAQNRENPQTQEWTEVRSRTAKPAGTKQTYAGAASRTTTTTNPGAPDEEVTNLAEVLKDVSKLQDLIALVRQIGNIFHR